MSHHIKLLGPLTIEQNGRVAKIQQSPKGSALLAYLIYTGKTHGREQVADLLWQSTSTKQSLHRLRELLSRIRKTVPEIEATRSTLQFRPTKETTVDLTALRTGLASPDVAVRQQALQLYQGEFLEAFDLANAPQFNEWLAGARAQVRQEVIDSFQQLCQAYGDKQAWGEAITAVKGWLKIDDLNETAYRLGMRYLAQNSQPDEALALYDTCGHHLMDELGVEPEAATAALAQEISKQRHTIIPLPQPAPDLKEILMGDTLADLGTLPTNSYLPHRRNDDFTGRAPQLQQIAQALSQTTYDGRPPIAAITGMGGVGKTQTAVEFCYRYGRYFSGGVFWLTFAEAENIPEEISRIGSERGIGVFSETEQLSPKDRIGRVQKALQEPTPRLLVFDNCEEEADLKRWAPVSGGCFILVTSRRAQWERSLAVKTIPLEGFTARESSDLLQQLTPHLDAHEATQIAFEVGHLPLALHMVGGFLQHYKQISPAAYLSQLQNKNLLEHPSLKGHGLSHSPTDHDLHIARTFAISFAQLDLTDEVDLMAQRLLAHITCFSPGESIANQLLQKTIIDNESDDLDQLLLFHDGLSRLIELGFLQANTQEESVVMHRLLNDYIRHVLQAARVDALTAVEKTITILLDDIWEMRATAQALKLPLNHLRHIAYSAMDRQKTDANQLANHLAWVDILSA